MMRKRPVIVIVLGYYFPGFKAGGPIRAITNLVSCLGDEFEFRILTRDRDLGENEPYPDIKFVAWMQVDKAKVRYLAPAQLRFWTWYQLFNGINCDLIYLNSFFSPFTIKTLVWRKLHRIPFMPTILAPRGEFSPGALQIQWYKKLTFIYLAARMGIYHNLIWKASSSEEASLIKSTLASFHLAPNPIIYVAPDIPLGISTGVGPSKKLQKLPGKIKLVFLARIAKNKNLDYALRILHTLSGEVQFDIFGLLEDTEYWHCCRQIIKELPTNIKVTYRGVVNPADIAYTLSSYHALFLPTRGENFGHAIIEALSAGCPVVISDQTPWRNLAVQKAGWDLPLQDKSIFIETLQNLVNMNHEEWLKWSYGAFKFADALINDPNIIEANRRLFYVALNRAE